MLHLLRKKTSLIRVAFLLMLFTSLTATARAQYRELNRPYQDLKPVYFGLAFGVTSSRFHPSFHPKFLSSDSVYVAEPGNNIGFIALGFPVTFRLSNRFQFRFTPQLAFQQRDLIYQLKFPEDNSTEVVKSVESILVALPVHFKLQSDRMGNFRVYMLAGAKGDFDLASNARAKRTEDLVKIKKYDLSPEVGLGFNFYYPAFTLSPELKFSTGIINLHSRDAGLLYSSVFDKIRSRTITFSLLFEG